MTGVDDVTPIPDAETKTAAEQCLRFLAKCAEGGWPARWIESNDAYALALTIQECYPSLDQIRIYVLTDRQAKAKNFKAREIAGQDREARSHGHRAAAPPLVGGQAARRAGRELRGGLGRRRCPASTCPARRRTTTTP